MKVKELMEMLAKLDPEMEIRYRDTYWENEGYGDRADDLNYLTCKVVAVHLKEMNGGQAAVLQ